MSSQIATFPYPFKQDSYRYSNNSEPLDPPICTNITPEYIEEITLKRQLLTDHPERCFQSLPHTEQAQWEIVAFIINDLTTHYPEHFQLQQEGEQWTFTNKIRDEKQTFTFGDPSSLPCEPLDFIGRHVQEDLILMMQRDDDLYLDAGQLCFPANWSLAFDIGMNFERIHSPIPEFQGLATKIRDFILRMETGKPWVRKNWSLTVGRKLDTSLETFDEWGKLRKQVTTENAGEWVHLRVEVQKLFRLPESNGILFSIHTHMISIDQLAENRVWLERFYRVLKELPAVVAEYKGIQYRDTLLAYVEQLLQER